MAGRRELIKSVLIEDVHAKLKKENRARAVNKAQSELIISQQEREINRLKRDSNKMTFETYQEMSTFFNKGEYGDE